MPFDEVTVEDRTISGQGLLRLPVDVTKQKYLAVTVDVLRRPTVIHESYKYSPRRQRYCTLVFVRNNYVIEELAVDYEHRQFYFVADITAQTLLAVKCAYAGTLQTFYNLGNALNLPSISIENMIKDFAYLNTYWDSIQVVCEGNSAVQVRIYAKKLDTCDEDNNKEDKPPPPPPPKSSTPPGVPRTDIDNPYDSDDKITKKDPLDSSPPRDNRTPQGSGYCNTLYNIIATVYSDRFTSPYFFNNEPGPIKGWDKPILEGDSGQSRYWKFRLEGANGKELLNFNDYTGENYDPRLTLQVTRVDGNDDNCPDPYPPTS